MPQLLEPALQIEDRVDAAGTVVQVHLAVVRVSGNVSTVTTARLGTTAPAPRLRSETLGGLDRFAG